MFPFDVFEFELQLVQSHLFQQSYRNILNLLLGPGLDLFLELLDFLNKLFPLEHFHLFLFLLLLQNPAALFFLLIVDLAILVQHLFLLNFYILLALLHLTHQLLLGLQILRLELLSFQLQLQCDLLHIVD